jgi:hypothetical protein
VVGDGILNKLIIIIFCILLSACTIGSEKATSVKCLNKIEYSSSDLINTYTLKYSSEEKPRRVEVVYAECENGVLIEKENYIFEANNNNMLKLSASETGIDMYYYADDESENHIQFLTSLGNINNKKISYALIQDLDVISGDILLYLDAEEMTSIQSEVYKDWTKFEGYKARAVILRLVK